MKTPNHEAIVKFFIDHKRRPREQPAALRAGSPSLLSEHRLANTLNQIRSQLRDGKCTQAAQYLQKHAPELLQEDEKSEAVASARKWIELWQSGVPRTDTMKPGPEHELQHKAAVFLRNRRKHYHGDKDKPGCTGWCEVCKLMTAAFPGWHETETRKRKAVDGGDAGRAKPQGPRKKSSKISLVPPTGAPELQVRALERRVDALCLEGGGRWRAMGGLGSGYMVASCGVSDGPQATEVDASNGTDSDADLPCTSAQPNLTPEEQVCLDQRIRDMFLTDKNEKVFVAGLFVSSRDGVLDDGGTMSVGCFMPNVNRNMLARLGDKAVHVLGAMPGDLGRSTQEHAEMALACFKTVLPLLQDWGVRRDRDCNVNDPSRPIVLVLGSADCFKTSTSATAACFLAFVSRFTTLRFRRDVGCTGDLSLSGRVLPVASLKEKLKGGQDLGLKRVVVPRSNFDHDEVVEYCKMYERGESKMKVVAADDVVELINHCVEDDHVWGRRDHIMAALQERLGRGRISLGPKGDTWVECCATPGSGRVRITGTVPTELEGDAMTAEQAHDSAELELLCDRAIVYLGMAKEEAWFANLPRGSRRYDFTSGTVTEDQPDGRRPHVYRADLHIHFTSSTRCAAAAALTLALVEVMLGVRGKKRITSAVDLTMDGGLVPAPPRFDTAVTAADYLVGPHVDGVSQNYFKPKALPPTLQFKGFKNMREVICSCYGVDATRAYRRGE